MTDYISEAEALSEIYDGFESDFKPYSKSDRRDYVDAKSSTFPTSKVGKWVITQNPRRNKGVVNILYLVDRNLTKRFWWSPDSFYAMIFENESAARKQAAKYRFNKVSVRQITSSMADKEWFLSHYE
ncbi:MAG: hypothetical protein IJR13_07655 [Bacteroidales bacterium]|nr:hypothetical protein [Bacteroidales bacterium]